LHANIISYALNVPSIGLVWNDKLTLFGEDIGYPERFFEYDKFNAKKIVDALVFAAEQGYEPQRWLEYKRTAKSNIEEIVEKWLAGEL
jgi:polysaccharide pyruvyl transferase WcaK-like protein